MQQLTTGRVRGYPAATAGEPMSGDRVPPQEAPTRRTRSGRRGRATSRTSVRAPLLAPVPVPRGLRTVGYLTALAVWTVPILTPAGPGNTAVPDATMAAALIMTILWLFAAGVANAVQRPWVLRVFLQAWCWSGIAWAAVLVFARLAGLGAVAGINPKNGGRAALTMNDPNMAGNYFLCALLVLLATRVIGRRWIRLLGVILILTAIVFTGSNGAGVSLIAALAVAGAVRVAKARGPIVAIAVVALLLLPAAIVAPNVSVPAIRAKAADSV